MGTGIVVRCNETFNVHHTFKDPEGKFIGIIGDHEEGKFLVSSFYSPSVAREIRECNFRLLAGTQTPCLAI